MAAAGVVHQPGTAQEVMRNLAPLLAEEGIDLNDLGDTDLDTVNAALARATTRYNQGRPDAGPAGSAAGDSSFVRRLTGAQPMAALGSDVPALPNRQGSAPGRKSGRASGHPGRRAEAQADRSLTRQFDRWLRQQLEIAAPSPGEESGMFGELLVVAKHHGKDLRTPAGVLELGEFFAEVDLPEEEEDGVAAAVIATLHDYVHFQLDTATDPLEWEEIHDEVEGLMDEPMPGADILREAIDSADQIDPDERRAAFAATRLASAVTELLNWIGSGRKVAPSGGLRRIDIAQGAGLLGIAAVGVDKLPPYAPDSPALIPVGDANAQPDAIPVRSMLDVPLLPAWWGALDAAEVIDVGTYRVTPGPAAQEWRAQSLPPLDQAEMIIAMTVAQYVCQELANRSVFLADRVAAIMISLLIRALSPGQVELALGEDEWDEWDELVVPRARRNLQRLERVGVLTATAQGDFAVPPALRGAVARGVISAFAFLSGDFETD